MIRKWKKRLLLFILFLAALIVWGCGIYYGQLLENNYQAVSVRLNGDKVSKNTLIRSLKNEQNKGTVMIPSVTAWNYVKEQNVESKELGSKVTAQVIEVYGDMNQIDPIKLVQGNVLTVEDYEGCVIDEEVSFRLFRATETVGNFITYQNKKYCIRGVIKANEPTFFLQVESKDNSYSNLELVYEDKESGEELAKAFLDQNGISTSYTILEGCFYAKLMKLFYKMPAWILGIAILIQIVKAIWKRRSIPFQVLALILGFAAAWVIISWLMEFQFYIPERLIPNRWSDFSFWVDSYKAYRKQEDQITYLVPVPKDVLLLRYLNKCIICSIISLVIFIAHKDIVLKKDKGISRGFLAVFLEVIAFYILYRLGKSFQPTRSYIFMLPIFIMSQDFMKKGKKYLITLKNRESNQ